MTRAKAAARAGYHHLGNTLRDLEADLRHGLTSGRFVPADWAAIAQGPVEPAKVKVTLRLDQDVERFFRAFGRGHLTRMNAVLRAFMLARLAGVVPGPEDVTYAPGPEDALAAAEAALDAALDAQITAPTEAAKRAAEDRLLVALSVVEAAERRAGLRGRPEEQERTVEGELARLRGRLAGMGKD